jgi:8-oxo-dGTP pyrophosphatase MutT (NUDIX family)
MIWTPRTTVAAIIADQGRFLFVREAPQGTPLINQPAGHLEDNESLPQAIRREVLEETGHRFEPLGLVGIYRYRIAQGDDQGLTYLRYCFHGTATPDPLQPTLDDDIIDLLWLHPDEIQQGHLQLRSPLVLRCLQDYLAGRHYPLELLHDIH